jgi:hypothetical protein
VSPDETAGAAMLSLPTDLGQRKRAVGGLSVTFDASLRYIRHILDGTSLLLSWAFRTMLE